MMKEIVIATRNSGKIREMINAFSELPVEIKSIADFGELPASWRSVSSESVSYKSRLITTIEPYPFFVKKTGRLLVVTMLSISENLFLKSDTGLICNIKTPMA